jgi:hypothetical protein
VRQLVQGMSGLSDPWFNQLELVMCDMPTHLNEAVA